MDPSNNMVLYLATVQGIFKTTDSGKSWINITDGIGNANIFSIGVVDSNKIYIGTARSSKDQNRLYYTTDGGESWRPVDIGLPEIRLDSDGVSILVEPYNPNVIYVGFASDPSSPEDKYILKTMDGGVSWELKKAPREIGKPVRPGDIAKATGLESKEVSKIIKSLRKKGKVISPKRCYYSLA